MSYHSQGLTRGLVVLRALGKADRPLSLADLSESLGLPKPTLVRLLTVLVQEQFVYREGNPPSYSVGHAVLEIAETYRRQADTAEVAAPYLRELARITGLTANVGVLEGRWVLHIVVEEPDRPLRFRSTNGSLDYTHCTGIGKMLLAALPGERLGDHLPAEEPYSRFTKNTIATRVELERELKQIRKRGYSIDKQERDLGVMCLALPIPSSAGLNVAVSVAGPSGELQDAARARHLALLGQTAVKLGENPRFVASLRAVFGTHTLDTPA